MKNSAFRIPRSALESSAARIIAARRRAGLTQAQAARVLGMPAQHLCRYERGHREPLARTLAKILRKLEAVSTQRSAVSQS